MLKGSGSNCTCYDCSVLYGGECYSTPINNMLDRMETIVKTIGVSKRDGSLRVENTLDQMRSLVLKRLKITAQKFNKKYNLLLPLYFMALTCPNPVRKSEWYRHARFSLYLNLERELEVIATLDFKQVPTEGDTITVKNMVATFTKKKRTKKQ